MVHELILSIKIDSMKTLYALFLILSLLLQTSFTLYSQQILINEIMSDNSGTIQDVDGDYSDWIELHNPAVSAVSMQGYHLTDNLQNLSKWLIPNTAIVGGGYLLIFASGKDLGNPQFHTNFSISSSGEAIYLVAPNGTIIDSCSSVVLAADESYARITDGAPVWMVSSTATPGSSNWTTPVPTLTMSHAAGVYQDSLVLSIGANMYGDIHFTTDGSEPTINDPIFPTSLIVKDKSLEQNGISMIPSSVVFTPPNDTITKINTLRYALFENGVQISTIKSSSYIIDLDYSLPIVSIMTDSDNFFSPDSGFYVPGSNPGSPPWYSGANYYQQNEEVAAHIEYIDKNNGLVLSQDVGIKLHGGITRNYSQKSLKINASSDFGPGELEYDFFHGSTIDEFDRMILRNGGQDVVRAIIRDAFINRVAEDLDLETMHAQPTIVFLNGEYWGIHILREKIDEHHIENLYGINKDSVDFLHGNSNIIEGTDTAYQNLMNYISSHDLSDTNNYNYVTNLIDVSNFIDYYLVEIFYNNREWPHNNIKYYKPQTPNGKWRWVLFDLDISSSAWSACQAQQNAYTWLSDTIGYPVWSRIMFLKLAENESFKDDFSNRFADLKNTIFKASHQLPILNGLRDELSPEIEEHLKRWDHIPSEQDWLNRVGVVEVFVNQREDYVRAQTREFFLLGDTTVTVILDQNINGAGQIKFSTLEHSILPWTGIYYKTTQIKMTASPFTGYEFSHWLENGDTNATRIISLNSDTVFTAVYNPITSVITDLVLNEFQASNSSGISDQSGERVDWIELYNKGTFDIDLNQLFLTDDMNDPCKWSIQLNDTTVRILIPGEFISFYADKDTLEGDLHCNFSLAQSGEEIAIYQVFGIDTLLIDSYIFTNSIENVSVGRYPDGASSFRNFTIPTFEYANEIKPFFGELYINEILAKNEADTVDSNGEYEDWIEIYNGGNQTIDLGGYFLSDDISDPTKWKIPLDANGLMLLDAGGFALFFADESTVTNNYHLPYKLSTSGENITLSFLDNQSIIEIDDLVFGAQTEDVSFGRYPDGSSNMLFFDVTTPKRSNAFSFISLDQLKIDEFKIFPNPFTEDLIIESNSGLPLEYAVYSLLGEVILSGQIVSNKQSIDLSGLAPNVYMFTCLHVYIKWKYMQNHQIVIGY